VGTLLEQVPEQYDRERVMKTYPIRFDESMNTVLAQELIRYKYEFLFLILFLSFLIHFLSFVLPH